MNAQEVITDEVSLAFGRRDVPKLVQLLARTQMLSDKRAQALRILLTILTNQARL